METTYYIYYEALDRNNKCVFHGNSSFIPVGDVLQSIELHKEYVLDDVRRQGYDPVYILIKNITKL